MSSRRLSDPHGGRIVLCLVILALFMTQIIGSADMASTTTTITHTRTKVTTETTTATSGILGSRAFLVLLVIIVAAAAIAVICGYTWGQRRTRKALLGAST